MKRLVTYTMIAIMIMTIVSSCGPEQKNEVFSPHVNKSDYKNLTKPNNQFAFQLLQEVTADDDGNFFISPTSLFTALSMAYMGAEGETKEEIAKLLQMGDMGSEAIHQANASFIHHLENNIQSIEIALANSMWLNERYQIQPAYKEQMQTYFNGTIEAIDMKDDTSVDRINSWVHEATKGKIEDMIEGPLHTDLIAYLLNAIYFKGDWTYAFDEKETERKPFYLLNGRTKDVSMMLLKDKLYYMENDLFQAVKLPYGKEEMAMHILLPNERITVEELFEIMTYDQWLSWQKSWNLKEGRLELPKFQLDYEIKLNNLLKSLGMKRAFEQDAEFHNMIKEAVPFWINEVKQKTFIDVNERGTEAAAATGIEFVTESAIFEEGFVMKVNRPFFFAITDESSGAIIFAGQIANPIENKRTE